MSTTWLRAALIRALKTAAQTAAAAIGTTAVLTGIDWTVVGSTAAVAAILSLLTSIGGLPEVSETAPATVDPIRLDDAVWQALDREHQAGRLPDGVDQLALAAKISDAIAAGQVDIPPRDPGGP